MISFVILFTILLFIPFAKTFLVSDSLIEFLLNLTDILGRLDLLQFYLHVRRQIYKLLFSNFITSDLFLLKLLFEPTTKNQ